MGKGKDQGEEAPASQMAKKAFASSDNFAKVKEDVLVLGIETSCDETSAAVVKNGREVLSNVIATQIDIHKKYGGVVPEIASRKHLEAIVPVVDEAISQADIRKEEISGIAVTYGPGLVGALLVGVSFAKAMAFAMKKPLIPVNHIEGHIAANYIAHKKLKPPFICLVVSGGHSHIINVRDYEKFDILGRTRDDAAGEAFDKIARILDLGYPGGPIIDQLAEKGEACIKFPKVYFNDGTLDFSFSGVKTAVMNYVNSEKQKGSNIKVNDVCTSFRNAVTEVLVENTVKAALGQNSGKIVIAGGVAANKGLRDKMDQRAAFHGIEVLYPPIDLCTDNAAMIASAGYFAFNVKYKGDIDVYRNKDFLHLNAIPGLKITCG